MEAPILPIRLMWPIKGDLDDVESLRHGAKKKNTIYCHPDAKLLIKEKEREREEVKLEAPLFSWFLYFKKLYCSKYIRTAMHFHLKFHVAL